MENKPPAGHHIDIIFTGIAKPELDGTNLAGRRSRAAALSAAGIRLVNWFFKQRGIRDIELSRDERGKPFVRGADFSFNLSHSNELACAAFSPEPLGVDIEYIRPLTPPCLHAPRFFTPEEHAAITRHPDPQRAFFTCWTRKEALLKAIGCGWQGAEETALNAALEEVPFNNRVWHLQSFSLRDEYAGAVCAARRLDYTITELSCHDLAG